MSREENKKLKFIYNPLAGRAQITSKLSNIIETFVQNGYDVSIYPTQKYKDMVEQVEALEDCYDLLVVSGGDGTLDEAVAGMMQRPLDKRIPIGYIPAGSTNDFANSLGISKDMPEAAYAAVNGVPFACDLGQMGEYYFVYVAAFGAFTEVSYDTPRELKNVLGHLAYVVEGAKSLPDIKPYHMKVTYGDKTIEGDFLYGMVSSSKSIGGYSNIVGKQDCMFDDGLFEVTLIKNPEDPIEMQSILSSILIKSLDSENIIMFKANRISFECEDEVSWTIDGEYGGTHRSVEIKNLNKAFEIILDAEDVKGLSVDYLSEEEQTALKLLRGTLDE